MKDERTLADGLETAAISFERDGLTRSTALMREAAQALRSQPSVEEVARVIAMTIDVEDGVVTGFNEAARQINSMYEGKG